MTSETMQVGKKLVELCNQGKNMEAMQELYRPDAVSSEAVDGPGFPRVMQGKDKIMEKEKWWSSNHEIHGETVQGPYAHGQDKFAVRFEFDVTPKVGPHAGERTKMDEIAVYTVKSGKIAEEQFFYGGA